MYLTTIVHPWNFDPKSLLHAVCVQKNYEFIRKQRAIKYEIKLFCMQKVIMFCISSCPALFSEKASLTITIFRRLSHTSFCLTFHLGAIIIPHKKIMQKNTKKSVPAIFIYPAYFKYPPSFSLWSFFLPFLSCSIYISYLYPAFGVQFIYEFTSKSI